MSETTPSQPPSNPLAAQIATLKAQPPVLLYVLLAVIATVLVMREFRPSAPAAPVAPAAPTDPHFTELAKAVEPQLGPSDAKAWAAFGQALDAGQPFSAATKTLEATKDAGRQSVMAAVLQELGKIVPPGTKDDAVTPAMRAAASAAARGIAQGLNKGTALPWHFFPLHFKGTPPAKDDGPIVAGHLEKTEAKVRLASHSTKPPESRPTPVPASRPTPRATPPHVEAGPAWHWRYFVADPRIEAFGYLDANGVFLYTETRWRAGVPVFAPACVGGSRGP